VPQREPSRARYLIYRNQQSGPRADQPQLGVTARYRLQIDGDCRSDYWRRFCMLLPTKPSLTRVLTAVQFDAFTRRRTHFQMTIAKSDIDNKALINELDNFYEVSGRARSRAMPTTSRSASWGFG